MYVQQFSGNVESGIDLCLERCIAETFCLADLSFVAYFVLFFLRIVWKNQFNHWKWHQEIWKGFKRLFTVKELWLKLMCISECLASLETLKLKVTECRFKSVSLCVSCQCSVCACLSNVQNRLTSEVYSRSCILGSDLISKPDLNYSCRFYEDHLWKWSMEVRLQNLFLLFISSSSLSGIYKNENQNSSSVLNWTL